MGKRLILISFLAVVGVIISTQMAAADYTVRTTGTGGTYTGYGPYQMLQGGEFTLVPNSGLTGLSGVLSNYSDLAKLNTSFGTAFQTFCLEENEYIYPNTEHSATISTGAINGGVGGATNDIDPISVGTADLYYQFATGNFTGIGGLPLYNYGDAVARKVSATALQKAIWWLEGEQGDPGDSNIFRSYIVGKYGTTGVKADLNNQFPVRALNLWAIGHPGDTNYLRQDQLVVVSDFSGPLDVATVPIPGALWLLGSGLIGLVVVRRRFTK